MRRVSNHVSRGKEKDKIAEAIDLHANLLLELA